MVYTTAIELLERWTRDCLKRKKSLATVLSSKKIDAYLQRYISGIDASRIVTDFEYNSELQKIALNIWVDESTIKGELPEYLVEWLKVNHKENKTFAQIFRRFRFQSFIHKNFKAVSVKDATAAYMNKDMQTLMAKAWLGNIND